MPVTSPSTPIATTPSHSRTPSLAVALPVYSSNRFKRRFRGVLWASICIVLVTWVAVARTQVESTLHFGERGGAFDERSFASAKLLFAPRLEQEARQKDAAEGGADEVENLGTSPNKGEGDHSHLAALPFCRKTFLFRFAGLHGQGSELNLLLRLSSLATHFGYTFLLDSSQWNYGPFTSYFEPLPPVVPLPFPSRGAASLQCRPPPATTKRIKVKLSQRDFETMSHHHAGDEDDKDNDDDDDGWIPEWVREGKHVVWGPARDMDGLDQTILNLFQSREDRDRLSELDELAARSGRLRREDEVGKPLGGLNEDETIPEQFRDAFDRLSDEVKRVWKLNEQVRGMVDELERRLGVSDRLPSQQHATAIDGTKRLGDLVVGVHVRLGDKYLEKDRIGPHAASLSSSDSESAASTISPYSLSYTAQPGLDESATTNYFAAAIKSINSILSDQTARVPFSSSSSESDPTEASVTTTSTRDEQLRYLTKLTEGWKIENEGDKPTLILMSDDPDAVDKFRLDPLAEKFRVVGTSADRKTIEERNERVDDVHQHHRRRTDPNRMVKVVTTAKGNSRTRRVRDRALGNGHGGSHPNRAKPHWKVVHPSKEEGPKPVPFIPAGFNENTFNSLPLSTRISQSRAFVRDVTVLSTRSDALVITGSSNVGRLMSLLMGDRAKGRVRSLDTRWFPTAKFA